MSALGQKQTSAAQTGMSALPLWVKSRHVQRTSRCPLSAKSGSWPYKQKERLAAVSPKFDLSSSRSECRNFLFPAPGEQAQHTKARGK